MTHDSANNPSGEPSEQPPAERPIHPPQSDDGGCHLAADPWQHLREHTSARIALGRAGGSLPTSEWLDFKQAHAAARDAVHDPFDAAALAVAISELVGEQGTKTLVLQSAACDRATYLKRPDLGRKLSAESREMLSVLPQSDPAPDLAIVVSDGLSATAVARQSVPLLAALLPKLHGDGWRLAPLTVVRYGRVAIQDEIGSLLGAQLALVLLGERPGLGSADSLGAYLVYDPRPGRTDADRNCVSNIRPAGLAPLAAAETLHYLLTHSRQRKLSGVNLKDERPLLAGVPPRQLP